MDDLARIYMKQKRLDDAEPLAVEALQRCELSAGPHSEDVLDPLESLADLRVRQGRLDEAESLYRDLLNRSVRIHGPHARTTRYIRSSLGGLLVRQGRLDDAAVLYGNKAKPTSLGVQHWIEGEATLAGDGPVLLVFYESWCPYSQRQVPTFEVDSRPYRERGLRLIGLSRATDPEGVDRLADFIRDKGITFASARTGDDSWNYFDVAGTPSAAAVQGGRVVFEGSLGEVDATFLQHLVEAPSPG